MSAATKTQKITGTTLNAGEVKAALQLVKDAVPTRTPNAVLFNALIGGGFVTTCDGDLRVTAPLDGFNAAPMLVPHARLVAILNAAGSTNVTFTGRDTSCTVAAGAGTWTLPTEDVAAYPAWDVTGAKPLPRIPADQFVRAVNSVVSAADDASNRFAMGGVLIDVHEDTVTFVGTDGRRLSTAEIEHDFAVDDSLTLVPVRAIKAMARIAAMCGDEGSVQMEATNNEVVASIGRMTVTARLLGGKFPNWRNVVPEGGADPTTVTIDDLLGATRAAAICTSDSSRGVVFTFTDGAVLLRGQSSEAGQSEVSCPLVEFGAECTVKLDPAYVSEWLAGLPADGEPTVSVVTHGSGGAFIMRTDCHMGLVMPLE